MQANRPRTVGTPSRIIDGREGKYRPPAGTKRAPGRATPSRNGGGRAAPTNGHINRKRTGKIYNSAIEVDPGPPAIITEEGADLPGHTLTACNRKLRSVYRYHIHCNDGTHLTGGITDDNLWQNRWRRISNLKPRFYDAPKGKAGIRFVTLLTE